MRLTQIKNSSRLDGKFPTTQFFILALCRLAEPIAMTSIFPYSWLMVKGFHIGSSNDASFYSGILIASFSLAESLTSMWWGALSDRIGRKPVLLLGCFGTMCSLLIVGFSSTFTVALIGRILGGMLNGNIGVIQTMVGELVKKPEHEPKAYSIMPFVWTIGTIVGPCLGGMLSKPAKSYPSTFAKHGFFGRYPWALPNLVCALLMLISIVLGFLWLEETHPDFCKGTDPCSSQAVAEQTPMITAAGSNVEQGDDPGQESYGTFNKVDFVTKEQWGLNADDLSRLISISEKPSSPKWFTWRVAMLILALGLFTYHSMCYDHLMPIFFQDDRFGEIYRQRDSFLHIPGGLGLSTKTVGAIMSVNGLIALFVQAILFPFAADQLGVWRVLVIVTVLHPIAYFIVPYLASLPENLLYPGIYTCLTIRNILSIMAYPVLLILLKQSSISPSYLGKINGLAASVGAACRTISPPVAGLLYAKGRDIGFAGLAWWAAGGIALVGSFQIWFISREKNDSTTIESIAPYSINDRKPRESKDIVRVAVIEVHEDL